MNRSQTRQKTLKLHKELKTFSLAGKLQHVIILFHEVITVSWLKSDDIYEYDARFLDPLMFGDYPSSMRSRVGSRLPVFTGSQSVLVKGSLDFVGINHYTTYYARNNATNLMGTVLDGAISDSGTVTQRKKNAHFVFFHLDDLLDPSLYLSQYFSLK